MDGDDACLYVDFGEGLPEFDGEENHGHPPDNLDDMDHKHGDGDPFDLGVATAGSKVMSTVSTSSLRTSKVLSTHSSSSGACSRKRAVSRYTYTCMCSQKHMYIHMYGRLHEQLGRSKNACTNIYLHVYQEWN